MTKIACLTTWWTIVSKASESWLKPSDKIDIFTQEVRSRIYDSIKIDFHEIHNIDSSDLKVQNIENIAKKIKELHKNYDWFVITHWTDTMAYTAASLSYMIKWLEKPIILTGSMKPIYEEWSDRIDNLINSFNSSIWWVLSWVFICFWNKLIYWNKRTKIDSENFDTFDSPNLSLVWNFKANQLIYNRELVDEINKNIKNTYSDLDIDTKLENKVYLLKMTPTTDYSIFEYFRNIKASWLVIEWYWDWNVPSDENFKKEIEKCLWAWIQIFLKSQCLSWLSQSKYSWWKTLIDMWCINPALLTSEASLAKLMWWIEKWKWKGFNISNLLNSNINWDLNLF